MKIDNANCIRAAVAVCLVVVLYALTWPLQDYDTFWHLAYGREMVATGRFIDREIFSYTAYGTPLGSHSQLAQVLLFLLWSVGGANALLGFKLLVAAGVFLLLVETARLAGADRLTGAALATLVLVAGMHRLVERPELFSILLQALLLFLLLRARRHDYLTRTLWLIPPMMVAWDYLHGAVYGLIMLLAFTGAEGGLCLYGWYRHRQDAERTDVFRCKARPLFVVVAVAGLVMALHPNGLLNYGGFWRVGTLSDEFSMFGEWMPPTMARFPGYFVWLAITGLAALVVNRRADKVAVAILLPFLYLSLTYNRAALAFGMASLPLVAQALGELRGRISLPVRRTLFSLSLAVVVVLATLAYKVAGVPAVFRFGTGLNEQIFPVGSVRFVQAQNLTGNLYNMDGFGGYLAFFAAPERRIFHYNQPGVFTVLFDYLHKPQSRAQWRINYAIAGTQQEINMFEAEGFKAVYREPGSILYVRNSQDNAALIDRYEVRYFQPLVTGSELISRGLSDRYAGRFLEEVSTYLTYRHDERIAAVFANILRRNETLPAGEKLRLATPALARNNTPELLLLAGQFAYAGRDPEQAESYFRQSLAGDPDGFSARLGLGYLYYDRGDFAAALSEFERLVSSDPRAADAHYALGLAAMRLCRQEDARRGFNRYLELSPPNPYAARARKYLQDLPAACSR